MCDREQLVDEILPSVPKVPTEGKQRIEHHWSNNLSVVGEGLVNFAKLMVQEPSHVS